MSSLLLISIVICTALYLLFFKKEKSSHIPLDNIIDNISVNGLAPFEDDAINPLSGESCLLKYENAQYYGFKTLRGVENVIPMGSGTLYLTDSRIIFAGELRTVNILKRDIVRVQCTSSRLNIHVKNKQKPVMIYHPMAPVFEYATKLLLNNALIIREDAE